MSGGIGCTKGLVKLSEAFIGALGKAATFILCVIYWHLFLVKTRNHLRKNSNKFGCSQTTKVLRNMQTH